MYFQYKLYQEGGCLHLIPQCPVQRIALHGIAPHRLICYVVARVVPYVASVPGIAWQARRFHAILRYVSTGHRIAGA
eukprot:2246712-Rhodomonas_salina.1